jgi:Na+/H+-dicarboxylate symporter
VELLAFSAVVVGVAMALIYVVGRALDVRTRATDSGDTTQPPTDDELSERERVREAQQKADLTFPTRHK